MQSNTRLGKFPIPAGADLSDLEAILAMVTSDSGAAVATLPAADTDVPIHLLEKGAASGESVDLIPFSVDRNHRVTVKDAVVPGDQLVLAATATAADKGKLRKLPTAAGTYKVLAIAEESMGAGGHALVRPCPLESVTVTE